MTTAWQAAKLDAAVYCKRMVRISIDTHNLSRPRLIPKGRFAPSPTGPLHLGSLLTAIASYLSVKSKGGEWLLRIDDLDIPRCVPGAAEAIVHTLAEHGLEPDQPVIYQSNRQDAYDSALEQLLSDGLVYRCVCSRKILAGHPIYPGTCRSKSNPEGPTALRFRMPDQTICFVDGIQGPQTCIVHDEVGDVVLRRRDGSIAYHLACAVDDGDTGVTEVVRGMDLLSSTPAQIALMNTLRLTIPSYCHLPILLNRYGQKLSKQTFAEPLNPEMARVNVSRCLLWLGIPSSAGSFSEPIGSMIGRAIEAFDIRQVPTDLPAGIAE